MPCSEENEVQRRYVHRMDEQLRTETHRIDEELARASQSTPFLAIPLCVFVGQHCELPEPIVANPHACRVTSRGGAPTVGRLCTAAILLRCVLNSSSTPVPVHKLPEATRSRADASSAGGSPGKRLTGNGNCGCTKVSDGSNGDRASLLEHVSETHQPR